MNAAVHVCVLTEEVDEPKLTAPLTTTDPMKSINELEEVYGVKYQNNESFVREIVDKVSAAASIRHEFAPVYSVPPNERSITTIS
jgi:hypothetical protein